MLPIAAEASEGMKSLSQQLQDLENEMDNEQLVKIPKGYGRYLKTLSESL